MTIRNIEKLTYEEAKEIMIKKINLKDHEIIFADLGGAFGYSVLVFKNKKHLYYADDFELHHRYMTRIELDNWYIETMRKKLFTEKELLLDEVADYDEKNAKEYYVRNYYIQQFDYLSMFCIQGSDSEKEYEAKKHLYKYKNNECFCLVKDKNICDFTSAAIKNIYSSYEKIKNNADQFGKNFKKEVLNYEAFFTDNYTEPLAAIGFTWSMLSDEQKYICKKVMNECFEKYA